MLVIGYILIIILSIIVWRYHVYLEYLLLAIINIIIYLYISIC